ncbi:MAG: hypothetical protein HYU75_16015, partial [Betaproteobacteria bacterium]|nr:hypothetical protein [Betaproteobacteria bacterium]
MNTRLAPWLVGIVALVVIANMSMFTVDQRQRAIVFQLGEIREIIAAPGLQFKWPLIQNVRYIDNRILTLDTPDTERFITSEKKNVLVLGDSHAADLYVALKKTHSQINFIQATGGGCTPITNQYDDKNDACAQ